MASGFTIKVIRDDVTKDLRQMIRKVQSPTPLLRAIGTGLVGLAKESFNDASKRPAPWASRKDGSKATLKSREATLWRSIKVQSISATNVKIGSDRPYAAIHQLGGVSRPMPARPYFPFLDDKLTMQGEKRLRSVLDAYMKLPGLQLK
jgi:phage gpG-like protein